MKKVAAESAVGLALAHDLTQITLEGVRSTRFSRGHVFSAEDIPVLLDMGKANVFVGDPDSDEVHEEDAAIALAKVLGANVVFSEPVEGKITVTAACDGLFRVNSDALVEINSVPDWTVVTRRQNVRVSAGGLLGGLRIVPLCTAKANVDAAVALAETNYPVLEVVPFKPLKTGLIITGGEVFSGRLPDKFEPVIRAKLEPFGAEVIGAEKAPDDTEYIYGKIIQFVERGAELVLLTGGMSVDPDDLTPGAIKRASDEFVTHGSAMQPGNMLTLGYRGDTAIIGVPAASLKNAVTSFDVFLPRVLAGIRLCKRDFIVSGENGICLKCEHCIFPNCQYGC
ncbi:MAG: molybdopterin-binding protein [Oscillospiraceae bacterium]|jgi:hypothetical protein|nr:molybdopterin-binding protein [Oscillospiraceae bacterium]